MSGAADSTAKLFARASSLLIGAKADAIGDHDAREMLRALDYAVPESASTGDGISPETANRAHLLDVASRFARVFELAAPDAPGLIAFGAQFDPVLADLLHQGSPLVGVSGVGLSLQQAFQSCIGEAVEYLSQLHNQSDALLESGIDDRAAGLGPQALELVVDLSKRRTRPDRGLSWHRATRLSDGFEVMLPADLCVRRPPAHREFTPPFPLSIGSAAGVSREAAALHGLLELIERDATSLWWRGGQFGRLIPPHHPAAVAAADLVRQLRHGVAAPRRTWLLDITTDIGVPCVVALSCRPDGSGFAFGLSARPRLEAAVCSAIVELCQGELADAVVATKRIERGDAALNAQYRIHLRRAAIHADQCKLLHPIAEPATHLAFDTTETSAVFYLIVERLKNMGIEAFGLDLTRPHFAVPVMRVIAPGLQLEPSEIVTTRLQHTMARTGGGATYTGGVALM